MSSGPVTPAPHLPDSCEAFYREFPYLQPRWCWLFSYGIFLVVCGAVAIVIPPVATAAAMIVLGVALMVSGIATILASFWSGRWSGLMLQLLVGILYLVAGYVISDRPVVGAKFVTAYIAAYFIVLGLFRIAASIAVRFPHWGWALLNGVVTLLCGMVIYRHFPEASAWVIGLLVGLELLFHGWNWIILSLAIRALPPRTA